MSAVVCRKRSNSIFEELQYITSSPSKKIRCAAGTASPPSNRNASQFVTPPIVSGSAGENSQLLNHLRSLFPNMEQQYLERALEASGNDLDSAIMSLNDLCLESSANRVNGRVEENGNVLPEEPPIHRLQATICSCSLFPAFFRISCCPTYHSRLNLMDSSSLIKSLSLHQRYWTITAVITKIDAVKVFKSGQGKIQKLTLMDKEGSKIYAVMFNETIDRFHNMLQIGKTYIFSNGQIKAINKDFYNVNENFEIFLNSISEIQVAATDDIQPLRNKLSVIEDIKSNPNSHSDIVLLVLNVSDVRMIYRQIDKKKIYKRDLQVFDLRSEVCTFTLWESLATVEGKQLEESKNDKTIILAKDVIGKYFNGFILSTTQSTTLEINPDIPSSKELLDLSTKIIHQHTSSTSDTYLMTNLQSINTSEQSLGEVKYYSTKVVIKGLNQEGNLWYNSCNTCKSKVFIIDGIAKCSKCSKDNPEFSLRYLIKLHVEDISATATFTVFDNEVEKLVGMPVTNLEKIKASNIEDYNSIITNISDKEFIFSVKVQDKQYGNRTFRSITVQSIKEESDKVIEIEPKRIKLEEL